MKLAELRSAYLDFFKAKGHTIVDSSSLVPEGDPTILFSNAGMNQFKDCFLGSEKRSYVRATSCQKCLRISGKHNDLENVGVTARHHTFFEMLGNFSFGDYFKRDAILFAWEFTTKVLGLNRDRLWVTVLHNDEEARELWRTLTDVRPERVVGMTEKDNFWAMGDVGPCGPCSEIYYYIGDNPANQSEAAFRTDELNYLEFWNLVFMQFNRDASGTLTPLPKPAVDTGMGLERMAAILQGQSATYHCDLLRSIIRRVEELSGNTYDGSSFDVRDLRQDKGYARDVAMRVIADHSRAVAMLVSDGIIPGNSGRGYVLRRIIRRAARHGRVLGLNRAFLGKVCDFVVSAMEAQYPALRDRRTMILAVVDAEERKFGETLAAGLDILHTQVGKLDRQALFPGTIAFQLHDTYGFPLDLTQDALKEFGVQVDEPGFEQAMSEQKSRSRQDRKSRGIAYQGAPGDEQFSTHFSGYNEVVDEGTVLSIQPADTANRYLIILDNTPFYAESGGQVGDTGEVELRSGTLLSVLDTQKGPSGGIVLHCELKRGEMNASMVGTAAEQRVNAVRRDRIRANHSATHLLQSALRAVLGDHVRQSGSRVDDASLRFDYSHFEAVTDEQMRAIQSFVNEQVRSNHDVVTTLMGVDDAKRRGAMALFGEKYGSEVRVVEIGPRSLELCGGTHVRRSGDIGSFIISSDGGIAAGVRRIECLAAFGAEMEILRDIQQLKALATLLRGDATALPEKVERLLAHQHELERELSTLKARMAVTQSRDLVAGARTTPKGIKVVAVKLEGMDTDGLKLLVDTLRQELKSGIVALGSSVEGRGVLVAGVTADLQGTVSAGNLVKNAAALLGGKGGGRPDFAQAGGIDAARLGEALDAVFSAIP